MGSRLESRLDQVAPLDGVGRGAGALGARGAKNQRHGLERGALQNFGGAKTCKTFHTEVGLKPAATVTNECYNHLTENCEMLNFSMERNKEYM